MKQGDAFFFHQPGTPQPAGICVQSLGIRERMQPGFIRHAGEGIFLLMHFHSPARLNPGTADEQLAANATILWDAQALHHYGQPSDCWNHSWMNISGHAAAEAIGASHLPLNCPLRPTNGEAVFLKYLRLIYDELHSHLPPDPGVVEGMLRLWLRETARSLQGQPQSRLVPDHLKAARQYIDANLQQRLRLPELARRAHLSVAQFCVVFKKHFGISPLQYVHALRMKRAEMLLRNSNLLVYQVAEHVGYADPLLFSKQFRRHFGLSPRKYMRR